jgi:soluble lytic murein transglycosylase-like protein
LIKIVMKKESGFDPLAGLRKNSRNKKAKWLMQLTPSTARSLGVDFKDPEQNIKWGVKYIGQLLNKYSWNIPLALAAYNAGPWNVKKYGNKIPPFKETKKYVKDIMDTYNSLG